MADTAQALGAAGAFAEQSSKSRQQDARLDREKLVRTRLSVGLRRLATPMDFDREWKVSRQRHFVGNICLIGIIVTLHRPEANSQSYIVYVRKCKKSIVDHARL